MSQPQDPAAEDPSQTPLREHSTVDIRSLSPGGGTVAGRYRLLQRIGEGARAECAFGPRFPSAPAAQMRT
jgi:hypothetical protein